MIRRAVLVFAIAAFPGLVSADTARQIDNAVIGRVFMSPAERDELDRLRKLPTPSQVAEPAAKSTEAAAPDRQPAATGYILRSRDAAWLWVDGDFQSVRPTDVERSGRSDDIRIIRHPAGDQRDNDAGSAESAGADDADRN